MITAQHVTQFKLVYLDNWHMISCRLIILHQDTRESYEIIYSQHMWLCTSPAYHTVHTRSIIIDIRLYINSGHLSCSHSLTRSQTDDWSGRQGIKTARQSIAWLGYHIHSILTCFVCEVDEHSLPSCGNHVPVSTTKSPLAPTRDETKTAAF